eukprot:Opistho-2@77928
MDAHAVFPLHFETFVRDSVSFDKLSVVQKKNGTVPNLYQHKITDQSAQNAPSGMRFVLFDITNNNRKIDICIEHTITGPGGQCEPSTDPTNVVVEVQVYTKVLGLTIGANPTVTLQRSHGLLNDRIIAFLGVNGGGSAINQRAFKVAGLSDATMRLLPQVTTSANATKGFAYELNSSRKIALSASASSDTTFTGPSDPSGILANDDVIYIPGSATTGTSFSSGVICVVASYDAHASSADTWKCNTPRAASATNAGIDYWVVSTASSKKTVSSIDAGTSPLITFSAAHGLRLGDLVFIEVMAGLAAGDVALFKDKIFRVLSIPTATTLTLDPPLASSVSAGGSGFLWPINVKDPQTQVIVKQFLETVSNPANYPGAVAPFYLGAMTSNYNYLQQKASGVPLGRPTFTLTVDTPANTNDGGIFKFYLQDSSAVSVCFTKGAVCPPASAQQLTVNLTGLTTSSDVAKVLAKILHEAAIPGIGDLTASLGGTSGVTIYLLPGTVPTKKPELFGNGAATALCNNWAVTDVTASYASMIGTFNVAAAYTAPVSWNVDAVANPTYVNTAGNSPAWAVQFGDDTAATFLSTATKSSAGVPVGTINPGDVMIAISSVPYAAGTPTVNITNTVHANLVPHPTKGNSLNGITFAGFAGYIQDKQKITLPSKTNIAHGQAITFWSILGGLKKYAVQFLTLPTGTFTPRPELNEVVVDVSDSPSAAALSDRLVTALDPLPGLSVAIGRQQVQITCDAAANTSHALNFNLFDAATNHQFVVWMDKGGAAFTLPTGASGVKVTLGDAVSADDVAKKIIAAATADTAFFSSVPHRAQDRQCRSFHPKVRR